jgi:hypothetical protein
LGLHTYNNNVLRYPIGGFRVQGTLRHLEDVPNTKMNHWQLQLRYTQLALEEAGVGPFASAQVIQVHEKYDKKSKEKRIVTKIHKQPVWAKTLVA